MERDVNSQASSAFKPIKWGDFEVAYLRPSGDGPQYEKVVQVLSSFSGTKKWLFPKQVHGIEVKLVGFEDQTNQEADAFISCDERIGLAVFGGDCPGLLIDAGDFWGAAHCGWRGVAGGIVKNMVSELEKHSKMSVNHWSAFVGPGICGHCYEVDTPVLEAFSWESTSLAWRKQNKAGLDLKNEISHQLKDSGLEEGRILVDSCCTFEHQSLHSFRRDGVGQNQLLAFYKN